MATLRKLLDDVGRQDGKADRLLLAVLRNAMFVGSLRISPSRLDAINPTIGRRDTRDQLSVRPLCLVSRYELCLHPTATHREGCFKREPCHVDPVFCDVGQRGRASASWRVKPAVRWGRSSKFAPRS